MNVFKFRDQIVQSYEQFSRSFVRIAASDVSKAVNSAAARRLAEKLAARRSPDGAVRPDDYRHALREVASRCLYGVDINPMAVELCRVAESIASGIAYQTLLDPPPADPACCHPARPTE